MDPTPPATSPWILLSLISGLLGTAGIASQVLERFGNVRNAKSKAELDRDSQVQGQIDWYVKNIKEDLDQVRKDLAATRTQNEALMLSLSQAETRIDSLEAGKIRDDLTIRELTAKVRRLENGT